MGNVSLEEKESDEDDANIIWSNLPVVEAPQVGLMINEIAVVDEDLSNLQFVTLSPQQFFTALEAAEATSSDEEAAPLPDPTFAQDPQHGTQPPEESESREEQPPEESESSEEQVPEGWEAVNKFKTKGPLMHFFIPENNDLTGYFINRDDEVWHEFLDATGEHSIPHTTGKHSIVQKVKLQKNTGEFVDGKCIFKVFNGQLHIKKSFQDEQDQMSWDEVMEFLNIDVFNITIRFLSGKQLELKVDSKTTVGRVKQQVSRTEGISFNWLKLTYNAEVLRNGKLLTDFGIKVGDVLELLIVTGFSIQVITKNATSIYAGSSKYPEFHDDFQLDVLYTMTVKELKALIHQHTGYHESRDITLVADPQVIAKELDDDDATLEDMELRDGVTVEALIYDEFHMAQEQIDAERAEQEAFLAELDPADRACNQQ
jgi:hypothetical protein